MVKKWSKKRRKPYKIRTCNRFYQEPFVLRKMLIAHFFADKQNARLIERLRGSLYHFMKEEKHMESIDRRQEVLGICLDTFIKKGLYETTVRDLSKALNLQSGGIYWWFKDKDDVVVSCAEEAAIRLERTLITPALKDMRDPERLMKHLKSRADEMRPTMKFFASVCACSKYEERLQPVLDRLSERYEKYAQCFAEALKCDFDEVAPYVYFAITTVTDYMIFGEAKYIKPQIELIKAAIKGFLKNNNEER